MTTTEDKDNAITPEYAYKFISDIEDGRWLDEYVENAPKIAREFLNLSESFSYCQELYKMMRKECLKLHEENTRLKQKPHDERGCDVDGCEAHWKAFKDENAKLQKDNETMQNALMAEEEEVRRLKNALEEIENCDEITYISTVVVMTRIACNALKDIKS